MTYGGYRGIGWSFAFLVRSVPQPAPATRCRRPQPLRRLPPPTLTDIRERLEVLEDLVFRDLLLELVESAALLQLTDHLATPATQLLRDLIDARVYLGRCRLQSFHLRDPLHYQHPLQREFGRRPQLLARVFDRFRVRTFARRHQLLDVLAHHRLRHLERVRFHNLLHELHADTAFRLAGRFRVQILRNPGPQRRQVREFADTAREVIVQRRNLRRLHLEHRDPHPMLLRTARRILRVHGQVDFEICHFAGRERADRVLDGRQRLAFAQYDLILPRRLRLRRWRRLRLCRSRRLRICRS